MVDKKVTVPLMVRSEDDIQFVEEDNDTVSENEPSSGIKRHSGNSSELVENVYHEIPIKEVSVHFLGVPKVLPVSRSISSASSDGVPSILVRSASGRKKQYHDYEKLSGASSTTKKNAIEWITDGSFFRRRHETFESRRSEKGDEEEHILEALRHIVRKCTTIDPVKRPASSDVMDLLSTFNEKS